jgi:hypothetical protein
MVFESFGGRSEKEAAVKKATSLASLAVRKSVFGRVASPRRPRTARRAIVFGIEGAVRM